MNNYYCGLDCNECGCASDICGECAIGGGIWPTSAPPTSAPNGGSSGCIPDTFDAGYGNCTTYAPGGWNDGWCDLDCNECGCASDICYECSMEPSSGCSPDTWDGGYGTCDTYAPGGWNDGWCDWDCNSCGCASDICSECS